MPLFGESSEGAALFGLEQAELEVGAVKVQVLSGCHHQKGRLDWWRSEKNQQSQVLKKGNTNSALDLTKLDI